MNCAKRGIAPTITGGGFLCWFIFGSMLCGVGPFIAMHKSIQDLNTVGTAYNEGGAY